MTDNAPQPLDIDALAEQAWNRADIYSLDGAQTRAYKRVYLRAFVEGHEAQDAEVEALRTERDRLAAALEDAEAVIGGVIDALTEAPEQCDAASIISGLRLHKPAAPSDALAEGKREAAERAWDEGWIGGLEAGHAGEDWGGRNPYRAASIREGRS